MQTQPKDQDLVKSLRPSFLFSKFFGVMLYTIVGDVNNRKVAVLKHDIATFALVIITILVSNTWMMYCHSQVGGAYTGTEIAILSFFYGANCLMFVTDLVCCFAYRKKTLEVLTRLETVDAQIKTLKGNADCKATKKFGIQMLVFRYAYFSFNCVCDIVAWPIDELGISIATFYFAMIEIAVQCQYVHIMFHVRTRHKYLNDIVTSTIKNKKFKNIGTQRTTVVFKSVVDIFDELCDIVRLYNSTITYHFVVKYVTSFMAILYICLSIVNKIGTSMDVMVLIDGIVVSVAYVLGPVMIVMICEALTHEARKTVNLMNGARFEERQQMPCLDAMRQHSLKLYRRKLCFESFGMLMDFSLFYGLIAGVTTYVIVILQFEYPQ